MRTSRKVVLSAVLSLALLSIAAAAASGASVLLEPAGAARLTSSGNLTFTGSLGSINCPVTLSGTLAAESHGDFTAAPEPSVNPLIGSLASGMVGRCNSGAVTFLFAEAVPIYAYEGEEGSEVVQLYLPHVRLLLDAFSIVRCLLDTALTISYDARSDVAQIVRTTLLSNRVLAGMCPGSPALVGSFAVTRETATVFAKLMKCRKEGRAVVGVSFAATNPGEVDIVEVSCANTSRRALTVGPDSRIGGDDPAAFRAVGIPAERTVLMSGDSVTLRLTYGPPREARSRERHRADLVFDFGAAGTFLFRLRGEVA